MTAFGDDHWRTAIAMSAQGEAMTELGVFEQAEALLLESYEILIEDEGALPMFVETTEQRLESLYERWGREPAVSLPGRLEPPLSDTN